MKNAELNMSEIRHKTARPMLWLGMASIVMLFAGLTSGYLIRKESFDWKQFDLPTGFILSTAIVLLSSLSVHAALLAARKGKHALSTRLLLLTLLMGLSFFYSQFYAFDQVIAGGIYFTGAQSTASGSYMYVMVIAHLLHVVGGVIALLTMCVKSWQGKYRSDTLGIELGATFWHFLGAIWIYLYAFLYFVQ